MPSLATSRVIPAAAMFSVTVFGLVLIVHLSGANESTGRAAEARVATTTHKDLAVTSIQTYPAQQTKGDLRVSILGITKGVAFLESPEPVTDGDRLRGNNAVPWIRAAVLLERNGEDPRAFEPFGFEFRTPDGEALVEKLQHETFVDGKVVVVISGHGSGVAQVGLRSRARDVFPTAFPPNVEKSDQSHVFLVTESGRIRETRTATFVFQYREDGAQQEIAFENIPLP